MEDYNKKIIDEISKELGINKNKVEQATKFFFNWQRQKFIECDNVEYRWRHFGKFKIIKNRYQSYVDNLNNKKQTNNNTNNENEID
jgi:nucleoid DNA-binding protein